ncbi:MAG TPA: MmcQ/YjbR family DNA-binding protein [Gemmatimonadaceae bacterium]|nr:MmcQ/YjbR family DNA-binding protein [Gemmatimonadaceae bacterium]
MTQDQARKLVLALDGVTEGSHHGHADFRVDGTIFVGFSPDGRRVNLKTTRANLDAMLATDALTFRDAWGGRWVGVDLSRVNTPTLRALLADAHQLATKRTVRRAPAARSGRKTTAANSRPVRTDLFKKVLEAARGLPGVEEGTAYGTRALRLKGKFLARLREDGESLVIKVEMIEREHLMRSDPVTFFITDHYRDYPSVLIHLSKVKPALLRELIEQSWRRAAPKRLLGLVLPRAGSA